MTPQPDLSAEVALLPLPQCWTGSPVTVTWAEDGEQTTREVFTAEQMAQYARAHIASLERQLAEARETATYHARIVVDAVTLLAGEPGESIAECIRSLRERAESAERQLAEVTARAEGDAKDAARYRWLRNDPPSSLAVRADRRHGMNNVYLDGHELDAAIDAASAAREG